MKRRIVIWGWWQGKNLGDNWIKKILEREFPQAEFIDTSVQTVGEYDYIIIGGGGLFIYDVIPPWADYNLKTPFGILGMGAEFRHKSNRALFLKKKADFFFVRDEYSLKCMKLPQECKSYDVTFLYPLQYDQNYESANRKLLWVWRDGYELLNNEKFRGYIQYEDTKSEWEKVRDQYFSDKIETDFYTEEDNIEEIIKDCGFVISGRYHGIVAAIQRGIPFIAIDICPKIRALLEECGLDEYCLKISEVKKAAELIEKAFAETDVIREKERIYCEKATSVLRKQMQEVKFYIYKSLFPLKVLHYGSYWMGKNDVVNVMADDLLKCCDGKKIDLRSYSKHQGSRIKKDEKTPNGKICTLDTKKILKDVKRHRSDVVILNSGGLVLEDKAFEQLRQKGVTTVGLSLSDPDVYPYNGALYASKFDLFLTNSRYSLENQYDQDSVNIQLMPFAASVEHHFYMPKVERKYDVVIVGHAREDRICTVNKLSKICKMGLYGNGWENGLGAVNGKRHTKAINSGKMYLSFSHTNAGYENVKVGLFEAMACNQVVLTSYMEELQYYFEIGKEILCYKSEDELLELVEYYLAHEEELEAIRRAGYQRFLLEHTYIHRWNSVLVHIYQMRANMVNSNTLSDIEKNLLD